MIRGCIEVAEATRVAGWIYAGSESLRDRLVLAFVGTRCAGAGKVDRFRKDLLDAGLGDGYCGFDFAVHLEPDETPGSLVVRLQNSDAALIQPASRVVGAEGAEAPRRTGHALHGASDTAPDLGAVPPEAVAWMRDRGLIAAQEHDFLRALHTIGAYERGLRDGGPGAGEAAAARPPEVVARDLFSLYVLGDVLVTRGEVGGIAELDAPASPLRASRIGIVALWAAGRGRVALDERSHFEREAAGGRIRAEPPPGAIDYSYGPDRLLVLHAGCSFAPRGPAPASGIVVFGASRAGRV